MAAERPFREYHSTALLYVARLITALRKKGFLRTLLGGASHNPIRFGAYWKPLYYALPQDMQSLQESE